MLPRHHRLRHPRDFAGVLRRPRQSAGPRLRIGGRLLVITAARRSADAAPAQGARVGFAVSRAVGNAVIRNRVQRRLRALLAERIGALAGDVDVVVRALPPSAQASYADLAGAVDAALDSMARREASLLARAAQAGAR